MFDMCVRRLFWHMVWVYLNFTCYSRKHFIYIYTTSYEQRLLKYAVLVHYLTIKILRLMSYSQTWENHIDIYANIGSAPKKICFIKLASDFNWKKKNFFFKKKEEQKVGWCIHHTLFSIEYIEKWPGNGYKNKIKVGISTGWKDFSLSTLMA